MISPLDADYSHYSEAGCINKSAEGDGQVLFKLTDDKQFFAELRTWLRTNKFIRLNDDGSQPDITRILADRGRENQERRKRLRSRIEDMLVNTEVYALGQHLSLSASNVLTRVDDACRYLLENTYTKLTYIQVYQSDPWRELNAVLTVDDIGQMGLGLDGEQGNPQATQEVEQYITLRASGSDRILASDLVDRFSRRPFGWPDAEILLIVGRLTAAGRISLQLGGGTLPVKEAFEPLQNTRRRREVSIIKKRQTDEAVLKQARSLTQDLFSAMGPATEKELFEFYTDRFGGWLRNLNAYKSKTDVGRFPGKQVIEQSILTLERLLNNDDSFDFFKEVVANNDDYLGLEEDYRDLHEFFKNQIHTWQQLQQALRHFEKNRQALEKNAEASKALSELQAIESNSAPYGMLHKVAGLVSAVDGINNQILDEKRQHAVERVEVRIAQLREEVQKSGIGTPELSNRLLRPLQIVKTDLQAETSIAGIYMLQTETASERFDDALYALEKAVQAELERQRKQAEPPGPGSDSSCSTPAPEAETPKVAEPKPIADIQAAGFMSEVGAGAFLEEEIDVERFIEAMKKELITAVRTGKRVRVR